MSRPRLYTSFLLLLCCLSFCNATLHTQPHVFSAPVPLPFFRLPFSIESVLALFQFSSFHIPRRLPDLSIPAMLNAADNTSLGPILSMVRRDLLDPHMPSLALAAAGGRSRSYSLSSAVPSHDAGSRLRSPAPSHMTSRTVSPSQSATVSRTVANEDSQGAQASGQSMPAAAGGVKARETRQASSSASLRVPEQSRTASERGVSPR